MFSFLNDSELNKDFSWRKYELELEKFQNLDKEISDK